MSHKNFRLAFVIATILVVTFALLPTAEARDLSGSRPTVHSTTDRFGAAMAWMADLLNLGHSGGAALQHESRAVTTTPGATTQTKRNTGSCIHPMGAHG